VASTCFEQASVYLQEGLHSIKHILPSTVLLIWTHERNVIELQEQVFMRMITWMSETRRRQYN